MHLIQQHAFDIQCSSQVFGKEIHSQLSSLLEKDLYPKLEILLDKYAVDKHVWSIDLVALELPNVSVKNWKNELVQHSLLQIEEYLKNNIPLFEISKGNNENSMQKGFVTKEQHLNFLFFHFLETGLLAENSISKNLNEIISKIEITNEFLHELIKNLTEDSICFERWIFSVPESFKKECIDVLDSFELNSVPQELQQIKQQLKGNKDFLLQWFNSNSTNLKSKNQEDFHQMAEDFDTTNNRIEKSRGININESLFISNAGLVILHPFLKSLFEQLNLCEDNIWKKKMNQHKAILLTQFLVTGQETSCENELVLNKILCGFPLENVVNTQLKITKKEKEKCYSLLQAVSQHWKVMSSSSIEALQESFLQRDGKIVIQSDTTFELWVEEKGFDILLGQLPWGIGMIKTPWMEEYLTCNWS